MLWQGDLCWEFLVAAVTFWLIKRSQFRSELLLYSGQECPSHEVLRDIAPHEGPSTSLRTGHAAHNDLADSLFCLAPHQHALDLSVESEMIVANRTPGDSHRKGYEARSLWRQWNDREPDFE